MASDSGAFGSADDLQAEGAQFDGWAWQRGTERWLPLYEAKMLSNWNHRFSTYPHATQAQLNVGSLPRLSPEQLDDPTAEPLTRYWVEEKTVEEAIPDGWDRDWLVGWRDITSAGSERTFVSSALPRSAVGHAFPLAFPALPKYGPQLQSVWSSLMFDYIARQKLSGSHVTYSVVSQLACPTPSTFDTDPLWAAATLDEFIRSRVLELSYTSYRIKPYTVDVVGADSREPFRWLPERRAQLIAELDAAMLHVYGLGRDDAEHVLDSFPVLRKYEERDHGEFRTKRLVLTEYDAMAEAAHTGVPYRSPLDPPPGDGPRHPARMT
jgi:hypothetical protein